MSQEQRETELLEEKVESMDDYKEELEASYRRVKKGDVLTGTVVNVTDDMILLDLKYFAQGMIRKEDMNADPDYHLVEEVKAGEEITAIVLEADDGEGNVLLSAKLLGDQKAWEKFDTLLKERTVVPVKITEIVKGGAVAYLEGVRGFIPASRLAAHYVEDLNEYLGKTIDVTVITAEEENHKLILSGKEPAQLKQKEEQNKEIAKCETGAIMAGTVETIKDYGAFVNLENGLTGLLHISQISSQRIKHPGAVLKEGQKVRVKILSTADHKISLSMKAIEEEDELKEEIYDYQESGTASTGLSSLLKGLKF
ncbi:S1 RNA-binding domain-containing protein [Clostridium sp. HBUAS56010]|uniref:S1 RNA-binding domain-containing protein n=1 Tax=Clostridium sp. HBUAS56010 TaxID=2571127 RepID=UPI001178C104|nr:S1 RNA-binding domain-containing protein [Clostridium sp. HBUAS56010]